MPKYPSDEDAIIDQEHYKTLMEERGIKTLTIKRSTTFKPLHGMELEELAEHVWTKTDKLFHLSRRYYGTNDYWWVIGLVNNKPTDAHYNIGDVVIIPSNPSKILGAL